ncbi:uncharacterized protein LOC127249353 [Andrographis paniculata]|uniref:uncharacterized protein LOC127249353 n=1 Tax=Andrographis paniculata TaxID=175694 RepID=UPI0021E78A75|nr:uncharacterized protein LOC127249353 [Andrographis paniculata]XP_051128063.1 uncharacterized protein LOC127249353 [Andrographis paniculata]
MLQLFLCEPTWCDVNGKDESCTRRISLLDKLESAIWSLMQSGGRSEARLWLCKSLSGIRSISSLRQRDLFVRLLRSMPNKKQLASQLLQLIFEKQPKKVGPIIAKKSHRLENFFKGNSRRIMQWFSNFSGAGDVEHGKGAKALSQFAFVNRDICWEELEWKGKHGQSPAMVATKPHYFLDLDVQQTVENFIEYVPEFWSSHEFSESLKDGNILLVDPKYFVNLFTDLMYEEELEDIWEVIEEFLEEQSFSFLCHRLLMILEEQDFCYFLDLLPRYLKRKSESVGFDNATDWFDIVLLEFCGSHNLDQLLLLNAVTNQHRQLLRLVQEEGSEEDREEIKHLVLELCTSSSSTNDLEPIMAEGLKMKQLKLVTRLGVQSWAIYFRLMDEFISLESWEPLFISNGIKFRKSDKYTFLRHDELSEDCVSDNDRRSSVSLKLKKQRKHRKKRKRNSDPDESYENDKVDYDLSNNMLDFQPNASDWLLSTDGFSTAWSSADLPEHLSNHCFITWLKWIYGKPKKVS